ncbi:transketolase family protein [Candidatus Oleimmundimicrobium sp.]|uniref:transketolase family protein n=1 Tax=Candidatus Oleimmundimicrobium sp. TaxID=3060597 RepID=UPI0027264A61|nr:transketolase family protein [Candidatus Oleimmundimicrobium sp.]MDO8885701.1 transketolase family protein [Candidatus Oleimmundimicrobium sp.]
MVEKKATREGYGDALLELGKECSNVVVLDADLAKSTQSYKFKEAFPGRFFDCGVAEQSMMGTAAGLAASGMICYTGSFAIFATGRAFEQVRNTIVYSNLNVKICPTHAGITVGEDGASHQTVEDLALMRVIPNLKVIIPADYYEAKAAVKAAATIDGPIFIRLGRPKISTIFDENYKFEFGKVLKLREGKDVTICATGIMVGTSLEAAKELAKKGIEAEVLNIHTLKPLDEKTVLESVKKTRAVVTAEEHSIIGGLGGAISELLGKKMPLPIEMVGIKDKFGTSGSIPELLDYFGLSKQDVVTATKSVLVRRS